MRMKSRRELERNRETRAARLRARAEAPGDGAHDASRAGTATDPESNVADELDLRVARSLLGYDE